MDISALIIAYNDKRATLNCLNYLLQQTIPLKLIIIVDNSEETIFFADETYAKNVCIIRNNANLGVASALNIGFTYAIDNGYRWCWTFDQDSEPLPNALEELENSIRFLDERDVKDVGIIASTGISRKYNTLYRGNLAKWVHPFKKIKRINVCYECDLSLTAGSLTSLEFVSKHGGARSDFFIDWVDFELCIRMKKNNFKIYCCQTSYYKHQIGGDIEYAKNNKERSVISLFRKYMLIRNSTMTILYYSSGFFRFFYYPLFIIREYFNAEIEGKNKIFIHAIMDGVMKNTGKVNAFSDVEKIVYR